MKRIGSLLIIGAIAMIAFYYVYQITTDKKIEQEVNNYIEETTIIDNENIENEVVEIIEEKKETKKEINYTAILEIPSINLKRGVVDSPKNFNSINYAISVDKNSNYPNEKGNFILYAHSGNSSIAYFKNLNKVNVGDSIYIYYNGTKYQYEIYDKYDIEKTGKAKVKSSDSNNYITLITCNQNKKDKQIVVVGKLVDSTTY